MNIIIFDHKNQLHQFHAHKKWVSSFVHDYSFLGFDRDKRQHLIDSISGTETPKKVISLKDNEAISQLKSDDLIPSADYGMTIIDCALKTIVSMNEYSLIGTIRSIEILNLLSPRLIQSNKKEIILKYRSFFEHKALDIPEALNDKFLKNIDYVLKKNDFNHPLKENIISKIKTNLKTLFETDNLIFQDFKLSKTLGWKITSDLDKDSMKTHKKMIMLLEKNGINLQPHIKEWNDFYNDSREMYFEEGDDTEFITNTYEEIKISKEKKLLTKTIAPAPLKENALHIKNSKKKI